MIQRYVMVVCDTCDEEFGPEKTEAEVRKQARGVGWKVGRNRSEKDFCPIHRQSATNGRP